MYGGGNTFEGISDESIVQEDPVNLSEFEARIARGEKIEPSDWMPQLHRKQLIRLIEQHAHSEIIGAFPFFWIKLLRPLEITQQGIFYRSGNKVRII
jgi:ring-1,2-phenylacetyl-CoA epoxidase subunit PaaA